MRFLDPLSEVWEREKFFARTFADFLSKSIKVLHETNKTQLFSLYNPLKDLMVKRWLELLTFLFSMEQIASERKYIALQFPPLVKSIEHVVSDMAANILEAFSEDMFKQCIIENLDFKKVQNCLSKVKKRRGWSNELQYKEIHLWKERLDRNRVSHHSVNASKCEITLSRLDGLYEKVKNYANEVTKVVIEAQNIERTHYLQNLKSLSRQQYLTRKSWSSLIEAFTHERAIWFDENAYPQSWMLDNIEGPSRIRRRLKRCHLTLSERFFLDSSKHKSKEDAPKLPLSYLIESNRVDDSSAFKEEVNINESISLIIPATIVTPKEEFIGELLIGSLSIHFVGHNSKSAKESDFIKERWCFADIREIEERRYQLKNNAIELFLTIGTSYLIAFNNQNERQEFLNKLTEFNLPNRIETVSLAHATQHWRDRSITNFEYLMFLNKSAGRSFNDLMQYPVFPFVISDYTSDSINFKDGKLFRDLSKPMAVQEKQREQFYIQQFNYLKGECERQEPHQFMPVMAPFHYGKYILKLYSSNTYFHS